MPSSIRTRRKHTAVLTFGAVGAVLTSWPIVVGRASLLDHGVLAWIFGIWFLVVVITAMRVEARGDGGGGGGRLR